MRARKVQVFFYGSFMSLPVLEAAGINKRAFAPAHISGFEIVIAPHATLVEAGDSIVYGILANLTHSELEKLYTSHAATITDMQYRPEAVLVHTRGGKTVPAMTYISTDAAGTAPDASYMNNMKKTAKDYGFPRWYQDHIASFGG